MKANFRRIVRCFWIGMLHASVICAKAPNDYESLRCAELVGSNPYFKTFIYTKYGQICYDVGAGLGITQYLDNYAIDFGISSNEIMDEKSTIITWSFPELSILKFANQQNLTAYCGLGGSAVLRGVCDFDLTNAKSYGGVKATPLLGVAWGQHAYMGVRLQVNLDMHYYPQLSPHFLSRFVWAPYISVAMGMHFWKR